MTDADPPGERVRVLIVEDETLVSMLLIDLVEDTGFEVVGPAITADEALALAEADPPQVAIVDVTLHGEDAGLQVGAELLRRHNLGLIFVSGHGGVKNWSEVKALAPVAVLQKPCLPTQVMDALREAARVEAGRRTRPG